MTPQEVVKTLMRKLTNHGYTSSTVSGQGILDAAIRASSRYASTQDVIDAMKSAQVQAEKDAVKEVLGDNYDGKLISEIDSSILNEDAENNSKVLVTSNAFYDGATPANVTVTVEDVIKERKAYIFLENYCGIQLNKRYFFVGGQATGYGDSVFLNGKQINLTGNTDTGAITGSDAGGSDTEKTAASIVPEIFVNTYIATTDTAQNITTGTRDWVVKATSADDTITAGGADSINADAGDDLITVNGNGATVTSGEGADSIEISAEVKLFTVTDLNSEDTLTINGSFEVGAAKIEDLMLVITDKTGTRKITLGDFDNAKSGKLQIGNASITIADWLTNSGIDLDNLEETTFAESVGVGTSSGQLTSSDDDSRIAIDADWTPPAQKETAEPVTSGTVQRHRSGGISVNLDDYTNMTAEGNITDDGGNIVGEVSSSYPNATTFTLNGLTIHLLGETSDTKGSPENIQVKTFDQLTTDQKTIIAGLFKWWAKEALKLNEDSYDIGFNSDTATVKDIGLYFFDSSSSGTLATVWNWQKTTDGTGVKLMLNVNMNYYKNLSSNDVNGEPTKEGAGYLDRTLAHEMTHAVMATNVRYFNTLPKFLKEGIAELTHGIDDERGNSIFQIAYDATELEASLDITNTGTGSQEVGDAYSGGYMFLRYFAKQTATQTLNAPVFGEITATVDLSGNGIYYILGNSTTESAQVAATLPEGAIKLGELKDNVYTVNDSGVHQVINGATGVSISGLTSNDTFNGTNGADTVTTAQGANLINTDAGNDEINFTGQYATINTGADDDIVNASEGYHNLIITGAGADKITVSSDNFINAGSGNDQLLVNNDNTIIAGAGDDTIQQYVNSDGGNVYVFNAANFGNDLIKCFTANDTISLASGFSYELGGLTSGNYVDKDENPIGTYEQLTITVKRGAEVTGTIQIKTAPNKTFGGDPNIIIQKEEDQMAEENTINNVIYEGDVTGFTSEVDSVYVYASSIFSGNTTKATINVAAGDKTATDDNFNTVDKIFFYDGTSSEAGGSLITDWDVEYTNDPKTVVVKFKVNGIDCELTIQGVEGLQGFVTWDPQDENNNTTWTGESILHKVAEIVTEEGEDDRGAFKIDTTGYFGGSITLSGLAEINNAFTITAGRKIVFIKEGLPAGVDITLTDNENKGFQLSMEDGYIEATENGEGALVGNSYYEATYTAGYEVTDTNIKHRSDGEAVEGTQLFTLGTAVELTYDTDFTVETTTTGEDEGAVTTKTVTFTEAGLTKLGNNTVTLIGDNVSFGQMPENTSQDITAGSWRAVANEEHAYNYYSEAGHTAGYTVSLSDKTFTVTNYATDTVNPSFTVTGLNKDIDTDEEIKTAFTIKSLSVFVNNSALTKDATKKLTFSTTDGYTFGLSSAVEQVENISFSVANNTGGTSVTLAGFTEGYGQSGLAFSWHEKYKGEQFTITGLSATAGLSQGMFSYVDLDSNGTFDQIKFKPNNDAVKHIDDGKERDVTLSIAGENAGISAVIDTSELTTLAGESAKFNNATYISELKASSWTTGLSSVVKYNKRSGGLSIFSLSGLKLNGESAVTGGISVKLNASGVNITLKDANLNKQNVNVIDENESDEYNVFKLFLGEGVDTERENIASKVSYNKNVLNYSLSGYGDYYDVSGGNSRVEYHKATGGESFALSGLKQATTEITTADALNKAGISINGMNVIVGASALNTSSSIAYTVELAGYSAFKLSLTGVNDQKAAGVSATLENGLYTSAYSKYYFTQSGNSNIYNFTPATKAQTFGISGLSSTAALGTGVTVSAPQGVSGTYKFKIEKSALINNKITITDNDLTDKFGFEVSIKGVNATEQEVDVAGGWSQVGSVSSTIYRYTTTKYKDYTTTAVSGASSTTEYHAATGGYSFTINFGQSVALDGGKIAGISVNEETGVVIISQSSLFKTDDVTTTKTFAIDNAKNYFKFTLSGTSINTDPNTQGAAWDISKIAGNSATYSTGHTDAYFNATASGITYTAQTNGISFAVRGLNKDIDTDEEIKTAFTINSLSVIINDSALTKDATKTLTFSTTDGYTFGLSSAVEQVENISFSVANNTGGTSVTLAGSTQGYGQSGFAFSWHEKDKGEQFTITGLSATAGLSQGMFSYVDLDSSGTFDQIKFKPNNDAVKHIDDGKERDVTLSIAGENAGISAVIDTSELTTLAGESAKFNNATYISELTSSSWTTGLSSVVKYTKRSGGLSIFSLSGLKLNNNNTAITDGINVAFSGTSGVNITLTSNNLNQQAVTVIDENLQDEYEVFKLFLDSEVDTKAEPIDSTISYAKNTTELNYTLGGYDDYYTVNSDNSEVVYHEATSGQHSFKLSGLKKATTAITTAEALKNKGISINGMSVIVDASALDIATANAYTVELTSDSDFVLKLDGVNTVASQSATLEVSGTKGTYTGTYTSARTLAHFTQSGTSNIYTFTPATSEKQLTKFTINGLSNTAKLGNNVTVEGTSVTLGADALDTTNHPKISVNNNKATLVLDENAPQSKNIEFLAMGGSGVTDIITYDVTLVGTKAGYELKNNVATWKKASHGENFKFTISGLSRQNFTQEKLGVKYDKTGNITLNLTKDFLTIETDKNGDEKDITLKASDLSTNNNITINTAKLPKTTKTSKEKWTFDKDENTYTYTSAKTAGKWTTNSSEVTYTGSKGGVELFKLSGIKSTAKTDVVLPTTFIKGENVITLKAASLNEETVTLYDANTSDDYKFKLVLAEDVDTTQESITAEFKYKNDSNNSIIYNAAVKDDAAYSLSDDGMSVNYIKQTGGETFTLIGAKSDLTLGEGTSITGVTVSGDTGNYTVSIGADAVDTTTKESYKLTFEGDKAFNLTLSGLSTTKPNAIGEKITGGVYSSGTIAAYFAKTVDTVENDTTKQVYTFIPAQKDTQITINGLLNTAKLGTNVTVEGTNVTLGADAIDSVSKLCLKSDQGAGTLTIDEKAKIKNIGFSAATVTSEAGVYEYKVTLEGTTRGYEQDKTDQSGVYNWKDQVRGDVLKITGVPEGMTLTEDMFTYAPSAKKSTIESITFKPTGFTPTENADGSEDSVTITVTDMDSIGTDNSTKKTVTIDTSKLTASNANAQFKQDKQDSSTFYYVGAKTAVKWSLNGAKDTATYAGLEADDVQIKLSGLVEDAKSKLVAPNSKNGVFTLNASLIGTDGAVLESNKGRLVTSGKGKNAKTVSYAIDLTGKMEGKSFTGTGGSDSITVSAENANVYGDKDYDDETNPNSGDVFTIKGKYATVDGGKGNDTFTINGEGASIFGGDGADTLAISGKKATVDGGDGADTFTINGADVSVYGGDGKDSITVAGKNITATIDGGKGDDTFEIKGSGAKATLVVGEGNGNDTVNYAAGLTISLESGVAYSSFSTVKSGKATNTNLKINFGSGSSLTVTNFSKGKLNIIDSESATTTVDISRFAALKDKVTFSGESAKLNSSAAGTTLALNMATDGIYYMTDDTGIDSLATASILDASSVASVKNTKLTLTAHDDGATILGSANADTLTGGAGDDILDGGAGNDNLTGGAGDDTFVYDGNGKDTITDYGTGDDMINFSGTTFSSVTADAKKKTLTFTVDKSNTLTVTKGVGVEVTIVGGLSEDDTEERIVLGGTIYDLDKTKATVTSASYTVIDGVEEVDGSWYGKTAKKAVNITGGDHSATLIGGDYNDKLTAGSAGDYLDGGKGDDLLWGGDGDATLTGGDGADTFIYKVGGKGDVTITDFGNGNDLLNILDAKNKDLDVKKMFATLDGETLTINLGDIDGKDGSLTISGDGITANMKSITVNKKSLPIK